MGHHLMYHGWRVLQVGIHEHHGVPARSVDARRHGDLVTEVARQADYAHPGVFTGDGLEFFQRTITAAIVDEDEFGIETVQLIHELEQLQLGEVDHLFFVVAWHNN